MLLTLEDTVELFEDKKAQSGNNGGGQILTDTAQYSKILEIPKGEMPADIVFEFRSTLDQSVVFTVQGCLNADFDDTVDPIHDLGDTVTLTDGSSTETYDYGNGPDRFPYYRVKALCSVAPTEGRVLVKAKRYPN